MGSSSQAAHRTIGERLSDFIRAHDGSQPTVATLQAVVADLVAGDLELALPLKYLLTRPGFSALVQRAGTGSGVLEREALLQSLGDMFSPRITGALAEVLNGFLDLPDRPRGNAGEVVVEPDWGPDSGATAETRREPSKAAPPSSPDTAATARASSAPQRASYRPWLLASLMAAGVAVGAGLIVLTRVSPFCLAFKTCSGLQNTQDNAVLQLAAASKAQMALEQATDLEAYQLAADQLDAALSRLNALELNPEQQQALKNLQQVASRAHQALTEEQMDQERLLRAEQAIDSARGLSGEGRQAQIDAASRDLQPISGAGFAAARAMELRIQLALMETDAAEGQGSQTLEAPVRGESLSTPPPRPQAPRPSGTSGGTPLRASPLW